MTKEQIATAFSTGEFEQTFDFLADSAEWVVVGENRYEGKRAILQQCHQVGAYFKSFITDFMTIHVISDKNKVVVSGTAEFFRDQKRVSCISACDMYEFNTQDKIQTITSYCIPLKIQK